MIEKVRMCLVDLVKSSEKLRRICLRLNHGDKSVQTLARVLFEKLVSKAIRKKKRKKTMEAGSVVLDLLFAKNAELWSSATAGEKGTVLSFDQLVAWLGFFNI